MRGHSSSLSTTTRSMSTPRWAASKLARMLCSPGGSRQYALERTQATERYSLTSGLFKSRS